MSNQKYKKIDGITAKTNRSFTLAKVAERKIYLRFVYSCLKIVAVILFFSAVSLGSLSVGNTFSYFSDNETSVDNKFQAGIVSLLLSPFSDTASRLSINNFESEPDALDQPVDEISVGSKDFSVTVGKDNSTLDILYSAKGELDLENPSGCGVLNLSAWLDEYEYKGLVTDFNFGTSTFGHWLFSVSIPDENNLDPDFVCKGKIVFTTFLANVDSGLAETFSDVKEYPFEVKNWPAPPTSISIEEFSEVVQEVSPKEKTEPVESLGEASVETEQVDEVKNEPAPKEDLEENLAESPEETQSSEVPEESMENLENKQDNTQNEQVENNTSVVEVEEVVTDQTE